MPRRSCVCEKAYLLYEGVANLYIHIDLAVRRIIVGDFFGTIYFNFKKRREGRH